MHSRARRFVPRRGPPTKAARFPPHWSPRRGNSDSSAAAIPEKFGGGGDARSAVTGAIVAEELGFGDISIGLHVLAPRLFAFPIVEMGTDDQRAKYLKRFAGADFAAATAAVMEPRFDFDLSAQQVYGQARRRGIRPERRQVLRAARSRIRFDSDLRDDRRVEGLRGRRRFHRSSATRQA